MLKTIKWLWAKAEERATERFISELSWRRQYHYQQSEISYFKDRYEPEDKKDDTLRWRAEPDMTAKEHVLIADELNEILQNIAKSQSTEQEKQVSDE